MRGVEGRTAGVDLENSSLRSTAWGRPVPHDVESYVDDEFVFVLRARVDDVSDAIASVELVAARAADQDISAGTADQAIVPRPPGEVVTARTSGNRVVPRPAKNGVVAAECIDCVVSTTRADGVGGRRGADYI
jgi:hypothetical protein